MSKLTSALFLSLLAVSFAFHPFTLQALARIPHPKDPDPVRYNITASKAYSFVWFRVAKVGTRSVLQILRDNGVQLSVNDYHVPFNAKKHKKDFKFAFVRNPWDRVVSCYCNKIRNKSDKAFKQCWGKGFDHFVDYLSKKDLSKANPHVRLQTCLFPYKDVDFIGRFEHFAEDLQYVLKVIGIHATEIPKKNSTQHEHYSKYYTPRTRDIIAKLYKSDIQIFGYRFEQRGR